MFRGAAMFGGQAGVCSHFSLRVSEEALRFYDDSYKGLAHDLAEGERIARKMEGRHVLFLAHHGVIGVDPTVDQAFDHPYYLERAAELLDVLAGMHGAPVIGKCSSPVGI